MFPEQFFAGPGAFSPTATMSVVNMCGEDLQVVEMWPFTNTILPGQVQEIVIVGPRYESLDDEGSVGDLLPGLAEGDLVEVAVMQ